MASKNLFLVIEGVGDDPAKSGGIAWHIGGEIQPASAYQWVNALVSFPGSIATSSDPRTLAVDLSSFTFALALTDLVAKRLLWTTPRGVARLTDPISDSDTTLTLDQVLTDGQVIWIGEETIRLGVFNGTSYTGCTRGYWSSSAQAHPADRAVMLAPPFLRFRRVALGVWNGTAIRWIWRGVIDDVGSDDQGVRLELSCREALGALLKIKLNRDAPNLAPPSTLEWRASYFSDGLLATLNLYGQTRFAPRAPTVHKRGVRANRRVALAVDRALVTLGGVSSDLFEGDGATAPLDGSSVDLDLDSFQEASGRFDTKARARVAREVALFAPELDAQLVDTGRDPVTPTWALNAAIYDGAAYHPLAIAAALLFSDASDDPSPLDFNVMGRGWGGGLGDYASTGVFNKLISLITQTRDLRVDWLCLGYQESAIDLIETVANFLRPWRFFFTVDDENRFSFGRFGLIDVAQYDAATSDPLRILPPLLKWEGRLGSAITRLTAQVGGRPWDERGRASITVNAIGVGERAAAFEEPRYTSFDLSAYDAARLSEGDGQLADVLTSLAALYYDQAPMLRVRVPDRVGSQSYALGRIVTLDASALADPWLIDGATGDRVASSQADAVQFAGLIVQRQVDLRTQTYTLGLLLINYRVGGLVRWRGPSLVITSINAGLKRIYCDNDSIFEQAAGLSDADSFAVGLYVTVWTPRGELRGAARQVEAQVGDYIQLASWFSFTPQVGDVVRLSLIADYNEVLHSTRTYVYTNEGDIYG